jgi:hypothetical protein
MYRGLPHGRAYWLNTSLPANMTHPGTPNVMLIRHGTVVIPSYPMLKAAVP